MRRLSLLGVYLREISHENLTSECWFSPFVGLGNGTSASAQEPPEYLKQPLPDQALKPHWDEQLAVMNPKGALDGKTKQLIALGVAAQIPCVYCVYGHTKL